MIKEKAHENTAFEAHGEKQYNFFCSNVNINCYNFHGERFENIYEKAYNSTSSF